MIRKGKCTNKAGCLLAYRGEEIMISTGELNCPECGAPLIPSGDPRKEGTKVFLVAGILIALVLVGAFATGVVLQFKRLKRADQSAPAQATPTTTPSPMAKATETPIRIERAQPVNTPATPAETPEETVTVRRAIPVQSAMPELSPEASAGVPVATQNPNLDLASDENRTVKKEVLKRIDLMPSVSADNKDKLYMSVERARQMGKLLVIPFGSGKAVLGGSDIEALKRELRAAPVQKLLGDPTAVFVILGFADTKGDPAKNQKISEDRAQNVLSTLRDKCGVANVMHAVGMGGSTLFDAQGAEKNRVAEIWVVLP